MPINMIEVYYDLVLALYAKGSVFKAVVAISVVFIIVNEWLKVLLASSMLVEIALLGVRFLKVIK